MIDEEKQRKDNKMVKWGIFNGATICIASYVTAYFICRDGSATFDDTLEGRVNLAVEALIFPCLFLIGMVNKVGSQRFGNDAQDPTKVAYSTMSMKTDMQIL